MDMHLTPSLVHPFKGVPQYFIFPILDTSPLIGAVGVGFHQKSGFLLNHFIGKKFKDISFEVRMGEPGRQLHSAVNVGTIVPIRPDKPGTPITNRQQPFSSQFIVSSRDFRGVDFQHRIKGSGDSFAVEPLLQPQQGSFDFVLGGSGNMRHHQVHGGFLQQPGWLPALRIPLNDAIGWIMSFGSYPSDFKSFRVGPDRVSIPG